MASIEAGLPEVKKELKENKGVDVLFEKIVEKQDWVCRTCKEKN